MITQIGNELINILKDEVKNNFGIEFDINNGSIVLENGDEYNNDINKLIEFIKDLIINKYFLEENY